MSADAVVRARIPAELKARATETLERMGLSTSDLIRLTFLRVAEEGRLPFAVEVPNAASRKAMAELDSGKGRKRGSAAAALKDLGL